MSIIPRTSPLNLHYRLAIVTNAFTPLGTIICKTLLKANALVLGIDHRPRTPSLTAGQGTHFQYHSTTLQTSDDVDDILSVADREFGTDRVDLLVLVADEGGDEIDGQELERLAGRCVEAIKVNPGAGAVVAVLGQDEDGEDDDEGVRVDAAPHPRHHLVELAAGLRRTYEADKGIRVNLVVPWPAGKDGGEDDGDGDGDKMGDATAYEAAKEHMASLIGSEKLVRDVPGAVASRDTAAHLYDCANLTLWLASDMCAAGPRHRRVHRDGSFAVLGMTP